MCVCVFSNDCHRFCVVLICIAKYIFVCEPVYVCVCVSACGFMPGGQLYYT